MGRDRAADLRRELPSLCGAPPLPPVPDVESVMLNERWAALDAEFEAESLRLRQKVEGVDRGKGPG
eukprot:gene24224-2513_t